VLRVALDVLADRGLPGLTMEAIAQRAGASKATLYRHWRSPGELLVDAMDLSFQELTERRREPLRHVLARARRRREIPASADIELAIDLLAGPFFYRRFIAHRAVSEGYAIAIVDQVLTAIGHPADQGG
jgi:AcrR family transcriptional regulator